MSPPHCSRHNMCQGWFLSRGWGRSNNKQWVVGLQSVRLISISEVFNTYYGFNHFFQCKKSKSVKVHRHVCSVTAVCLSAPARVRPRPRPAMVSSALSPCSCSRPAARRRPRLRTQSTVKFMQREERPPRQSPETTRSFAPTSPGLVFMVHPRPKPA